MLGYFICFTICIVFAIIAQKNKNNKNICIFSLFIIVLSLSIICGYRDYLIVAPRDVKMYILPLLNDINNYGLFYTLQNSVVDPGFIFIIYLSTLFSSKVSFTLFIIQFIVSSLYCCYLYKNRNKYSLLLGIIIYLFLWYLITFTIMRQSITLMLSLLSLHFYDNNDKKKAYLLAIIGYFIHSSSIIIIFMLFIKKILTKENISAKKRFFQIFMLIAGSILIAVCYRPLVVFMVSTLKIFPTKFLNYINDSRFYLVHGELKKSGFMISIVCLCIALLIRKNRNVDSNEWGLNFTYLIFNLVLLVMSYKLSNLDRFGYYFLFPVQIYLFNNFYLLFQNHKKDKLICSFILMTLFIGYWVWKYPITKEWETYPYVSSELNIRK